MKMLSLRPMFNLRYLASQFLPNINISQISYRNFSSKETLSVFSIEHELDEEEIKAKEAAIEKSRNKSELFPNDYNKQHDRPPYEEPEYEHHETLSYRRRMYGKYGQLSKVDPAILWPSKIELDYMKEYEEIAQPFTFETLVERAQTKKAQLEKEIQDQEAEVLEKVKNVKSEIVAFHKRFAVQKQKALALIEQKNKIIEKVRQELGYRIDIRDKKFKELFDKLQKEERKKLKAEKKALREEKLKHMSDFKETNKEESQVESEK